MKVTMSLEVGNRVAVEQLVCGDTRQAFREAMGNVACRFELSTFGPPGTVEEMALEDNPIGFHNGPGHA